MIISGTYNLTYNPDWIHQPLESLYLECDTSTGPVTINLFEIAVTNLFWNVKIYVSDDSNNAATNNITIIAAAGDTINTAGGVVLNTNKATFTLSIANEKQWIGLNSNNFVGSAYNTVEEEGVPLIQRNVINFTGQGVTASDNAGVTEVNVPIQPAYSTIQEEGTDLPQRNTINFVGIGVTASDVGGKTQVNIPGIPTTNYGLFAQTSNSSTITNTILEQTLIGTGVGTLTVPPNSFQVGDSFQANLSGHIDSKNNDKLRIRLKTIAGVLLADTGDIIMPNCTNQHWDLKCYFTIRSLGPSGIASIASTCMFTYTKNASNAFEGENISIVNDTTFDTTISNTLQITAQWNSADILNAIYTELFVLNKTY